MSDYPISIVIIGIGEASFDKMEILNEGKFFNSWNIQVKRDIVQFVKFNDYD